MKSAISGFALLLKEEQIRATNNFQIGVTLRVFPESSKLENLAKDVSSKAEHQADKLPITYS